MTVRLSEEELSTLEECLGFTGEGKQEFILRIIRQEAEKIQRREDRRNAKRAG